MCNAQLHNRVMNNLVEGAYNYDGYMIQFLLIVISVSRCSTNDHDMYQKTCKKLRANCPSASRVVYATFIVNNQLLDV